MSTQPAGNARHFPSDAIRYKLFINIRAGLFACCACFRCRFGAFGLLGLLHGREGFGVLQSWMPSQSIRTLLSRRTSTWPSSAFPIPLSLCATGSKIGVFWQVMVSICRRRAISVSKTLMFSESERPILSIQSRSSWIEPVSAAEEKGRGMFRAVGGFHPCERRGRRLRPDVLQILFSGPGLCCERSLTQFVETCEKLFELLFFIRSRLAVREACAQAGRENRGSAGQACCLLHEVCPASRLRMISMNLRTDLVSADLEAKGSSPIEGGKKFSYVFS